LYPHDSYSARASWIVTAVDRGGSMTEGFESFGRPRLPLVTLRLTPARRLLYPSDRGVFIMTHLQEEVIAKILHLAPEDVEKVLHFVETLAPAAPQRRSLRGRFAHLGVHISAKDIDEARKESWGNFPRDISMD